MPSRSRMTAPHWGDDALSFKHQPLTMRNDSLSLKR
jgi:hypothetical protein